MSKTMYATIIDGKFNMTYEDVVQSVKDNPQTTDPHSTFFVGDDGSEYSVSDIANNEKIELEIYEGEK